MEENNILIAEFMGIKDGENRYSHESSEYIFESSELEYHFSWDWLMPVVEKIETTKFELGDKLGAAGRRVGTTKGTGDFHIFYDEREEYKGWTWTVSLNYGRDIASSTWEDSSKRFNTKIEATYKAVVEFIKWYNRTK